ncbi:hypothetical protein HBZC1_15120 [Helicobacter bizzozeronii CIII-1]|uniref:Uncharacterized protein n=1 Tax=Helicobacter bizzozeronii (strain CIII-1) TaxID=1002804 RepID=F8KUD9_HELBC|nr:hypothetical protein HBZC1_15120 [Helicobacter bizzozeronii CIII-1]CCF80292.1 hypothetical protein HBZS_107400 [Helicobacter bizzozeronii CCUG 35545]
MQYPQRHKPCLTSNTPVALAFIATVDGVVVFVWWFQRLLIERENCH